MKKLFSFFLLISLSCDQENVNPGAPPALKDGWETASLEQVSIDKSGIADAVERIKSNEFTDIHSMLIIRNGKLVFEEYFNGFTRNDFHVLFSASKSYSSTLIGIAIDKGYIPSTEKLLMDYFPSKTALFTSGKDKIKLADILTMSSGLEWDEWSYPGLGIENSHFQMMLAPSKIDFVLSLPLVNSPGSTFTYNTGTSNLMAPIIEHATGQSIEQFAKENLFQKLSIVNYRWKEVIDSYPSTGGSSGGLEMMPRDMAKLGQLFLDKGIWNGQRIISESWVDEALLPRMKATASINYGFQWWNRTYFKKDGNVLREFDAVGDGGQWIFVFPELDVVVAFTGGNYTWEKDGDLMFQPITILRNHILPSIE